MKWVLSLACLGFLCGSCAAHDEPTSFVDLTVTGSRLEVSITASTVDLAHGLDQLEPTMLLDSSLLEAQQTPLANALLSRLQLHNATQPLALTFDQATPIPDRRDVSFTFHTLLPDPTADIEATCDLFPYDPRHRTFLNLHLDGQLQRTEVFQNGATLRFPIQVTQSRWQVFTEFLYQGIHHIFIGPDHILFVLGLLLLGGGLRTLLKIVTSFTVAHSITLGLATFQIVSPSPRLIEPIIALSIVFVGIHALVGKPQRDPRLWLAFGFGLIHGFGFAYAMQEMSLPRLALGLSLFSFNAGVELGQACIVLCCAPILAWLRTHRALLSQRIIATCALLITAAGAFWFFQRILSPA